MKIGLIAMSGIRVRDEELLRLGLTLPGFVERSKTIASLPSLGLLTLAGMTPADHELCYIEMPDLSHIADIPKDLDFAAVSTYSAQVDEAYELARTLQDAGTPVVMGGPHVTALPNEALQHCNAVVVGEGESCWLNVLEDAGVGTLNGTYGSRSGDFELRHSPMPAFELLNIDNYNRLTVQTSRGCPHSCEFCASSVMLTDKYKQKPAELVLAEINRICEIWENPFIEFADDNSFVNHAYWKKLLPELKGRNLRWFTETDISVAKDIELLNLMRDTGCQQVLIGLESPVSKPLAGLDRRNNWKQEQFGEYRHAIQTIQSCGVTVNGCFVLGLDGHTADIFDQVFEFVKTSELYEVQVTVMTPFPGTPLYARLESEGRLLDPGNWKTCTLFDINYTPSDMSVDELHSGFRKLVVDLYNEDFTNWRRRSFREKLRESLRDKGD